MRPRRASGCRSRAILLLPFLVPAPGLEAHEHASALVEDVQRDPLGVLREPVVDVHAVVEAPHRVLGIVEPHVGLGHRGRELAQDPDVAQDPERAPVRRDHEIVVRDDEIGDLRHGQVLRQRLP